MGCVLDLDGWGLKFQELPLWNLHEAAKMGLWICKWLYNIYNILEATGVDYKSSLFFLKTKQVELVCEEEELPPVEIPAGGEIPTMASQEKLFKLLINGLTVFVKGPVKICYLLVARENIYLWAEAGFCF